MWNTPSDWSFFRPLGAVPSVPEIVEGESFNGEWHFVIPEQRGRLHVQWQHAVKPDPEKEREEFIRLTLTARGPVQQSEDASETVLDGLNLGRDVIVRSFRDFMSDEANTYWGLKHVNG